MDISIYFESIDTSDFQNKDEYLPTSLGELIVTHSKGQPFPDLQGCSIALIGVEEDRNAVNNQGCALAPDYVRNKLYQLYQGSFKVNVVDLGNIIKGDTVDDTYHALRNSVAELLKLEIVPIILGGSLDLTYPLYCAYEELQKTINMVTVASAFHLGLAGQDLNSRSYLSKIILHQPNYLFNYSNIGYQSYFVDQNAMGLMRKLYFDVYRVGVIQQDIKQVEPIVRNADLLSFDISAIRQSDAPGNKNVSPNGLYGEEGCQIARYAGMSDKLTSIGFFEVNPEKDKYDQTAHLVAQMIWYFIEGHSQRKKDYPVGDKSKYTKYRVMVHDNEHEIIFYKSHKSDRWWMNVPYPESNKLKYERHHLVPCSYEDYQKACEDEVPDRWWQAYKKLS